MNANIQYSTGISGQNSPELFYRVKYDVYTVPAIEVGDNVQAFSLNTFPVINTSYDPASAKYNAALTANGIFRIQLGVTPKANLAGSVFTNISPNP